MRAEVQKVVDQVNADVGPRRADQEVHDPARGPHPGDRASSRRRSRSSATSSTRSSPAEIEKLYRSVRHYACWRALPPCSPWPATIQPTPAAFSSAGGRARGRSATASSRSRAARAPPARRRLARAPDPGRRGAAVPVAVGPAAARLAVGRRPRSRARPATSSRHHGRVPRHAGLAVPHARARQAASTTRGSSCAGRRATTRPRARRAHLRDQRGHRRSCCSRSGSWSSQGPGRQLAP